MTYTKQDVTDLRSALLTAKEGHQRTHEALSLTFDLGMDTMAVAEALVALKEVDDKLDDAVSMLDRSVVWDDDLSNEDEAVKDLYRIFEEAEQAGFFDRTIIDPSYGEAPDRIPFTPESGEDDDG